MIESLKQVCFIVCIMWGAMSFLLMTAGMAWWLLDHWGSRVNLIREYGEAREHAAVLRRERDDYELKMFRAQEQRGMPCKEGSEVCSTPAVIVPSATTNKPRKGS